jgi:hypothetical protein
MKSPKSLLLVLCLAVAVAMSTPAMAQRGPAQFLAVYNITVNPGANAQFEDYLQKIKQGAEKIGASQRWITFQVGFGGPGNAYAIGLQFDKWAEMDGWSGVPEILEKAYGADEAAKILRSGGMAIASSETSVTRLLSDLSYHAASFSPGPMFLIRVTTVKRDMQDAYRNFLAKLNQAWEKAGDHRTVVQRVNVLGPSPVYTSARPLAKWSERDSDADIWPLIEKAHGETEMRRLQDDLQQAIVDSQAFVIFQRPDLSRPPMSTTSDP